MFTFRNGFLALQFLFCCFRAVIYFIDFPWTRLSLFFIYLNLPTFLQFLTYACCHPFTYLIFPESRCFLFS